MSEDRKTFSDTLEIDGKQIDVAASFPSFKGFIDGGEFKAEMPADVYDRLIAYLVENIEGGTLEELAAVLGLQKWERILEQLLAELRAKGDLITAREPRMKMASWEISYSGGNSEIPENSEIKRPVYSDVYRLSPQRWIEVKSA